MALTAITQLVATEFRAVDTLILSALRSRVPLAEEIGHYLINSGGKRLRPLITLLSAQACQTPFNAAITLATAIEFIHTATLLHDDVVDESMLRRGKHTANRVWDNASAVLVGDFLYSRAFQLMTSLGELPALKILADATNIIAEGEVLQLSYRQNTSLDYAACLQVVRYKTAELFSAAAHLSAAVSPHQQDYSEPLQQYGLHLGIAFQLIDDLLDYQAENAAWGKNLGDDLQEGKMTLPLIYALEHASPAEQDLIKQAIAEKALTELGAIQKIILKSGALAYTQDIAQKEVNQALAAIACLADTPAKQGLSALAEFALMRNH